MDIIDKEVEPGMTVVDIGANIGYVTLLMAEKDSNVVSGVTHVIIVNHASFLAVDVLSNPINKALTGLNMPTNASYICLDDTQCSFHMPRPPFFQKMFA